MSGSLIAKRGRRTIISQLLDTLNERLFMNVNQERDNIRHGNGDSPDVEVD